MTASFIGNLSRNLEGTFFKHDTILQTHKTFNEDAIFLSTGLSSGVKIAKVLINLQSFFLKKTILLTSGNTWTKRR